ncbi:MAG: squalene synthase HpnD, partial [Zetaproteobacteria bacterium]
KATQANDALKQLVRHYVDRAEKQYATAIEMLPPEDRLSLRPSLLMAAIYHAQLKRIRKQDYDTLTRPAHISPLRKLGIAIRMWYQESRAIQHGTLPRL